jgi:hypothetical protein
MVSGFDRTDPFTKVEKKCMRMDSNKTGAPFLLLVMVLLLRQTIELLAWKSCGY